MFGNENVLIHILDQYVGIAAIGHIDLSFQDSSRRWLFLVSSPVGLKNPFLLLKFCQSFYQLVSSLGIGYIKS